MLFANIVHEKYFSLSHYRKGYTMKHSRTLFAGLILISISMVSLFAHSSNGEYEQQHFKSYLGFEHGSSEVDGDEAPYVGLSLGSNVGSRASVEAFALFQVLSNFPGTTFDLGITETPSSFALITGVSATLKLFKDSTFNPLVQLGVGNMALGNVDESSEDIPELHNFFYSSVATGLEVNIFEAVSITFIHGYRYAPNNAVIGIAPQALSGDYSSVSFRAILI